MPVVQDEISLVKVADGRGILGTPVSTYAQSTSGTTPPTTWSATRPNVPAGQYLWTRVVTTYTDNTTSETQTPTLMGKPGESGLGIKEKSINYAAGTSGNTPPTTGWQETIPTVASNQYLWTRTTLVYTDDSKTDAYSVGKMGANGADAQLLYLTASAENMAFNADDTPKTTQTINISAKLQNVTGTATFTAIPYIGNTAQPAITLGGSGNTRTLTSAQWTNKNWTLIAVTATLDNLNDTLSIVKVKDGAKGDKGSDGIAGKDGVGVSDTTITYAQSSNGTNPPSTGWTASVPTLIKGQYLWTKTVWSYTDSTTETGYTVSYNAKDGNDGDDGIAGKDGVGISATKIEYVGSTSGTVKPTTGWSTTIPAVAEGQYLWTRTTWTYTDNTSEMGYSAAKMGAKGDKGDQGATGPKGDQGNQGIQGPTGADGKPSYTHWAYAWSADGTDRFTTSYPGANLLKGTSSNTVTVTTTSGWPDQTGASNALMSAGSAISPFDTKITYSAYITAPADVAAYIYVRLNRPGAPNGSYEDKQSNRIAAGQSGWCSITFTIPSDTQSLRYTVKRYADNIATTRTISYAKEKAEFGSVRTPWASNAEQDFANAYPTYAGSYVDSIATDSEDPTQYTWQRLLGDDGKDGEDGQDGESAPLVSLSGATQAITVSKTGTVTPSSSFQVTGTALNTTISAWTYSLNGGNFGSAIPAGVTRSGNVVTVNPVTATFNQLTIRATDGTVSDVFTISRITDGGDGTPGSDAYTVFLTNESYTYAGSTSAALAGSTTTEVVVYKGINKITPTSITVGTRPTGLTASVSGSVVTFTAATTLVTKSGTVPITITADGKTFTKQFAYAISFQGGKGDPGENGVSVTGSQVQFVQSSSMTEPTTGWSATRPTPVPGQWLWTRSRNTFSDGTYGSWATVPTLIGREAIVVSATAPSNPSTGTLWQTPTNPNVQKWDGTKWVDWGIAIDNIVAENITIENGVFKRIDGLEIYGGLIVNSFDVWTGFYVNDTDQLWRKGTTTVANSEVAIDYQNYNKKTGAIIETGSTVSGVGGNSTAIATPQGVIKRSADFTVNGIELIDDRASGTNTAARMKYSDLIEVATLSITAASGWSQYAASGISHPTASRTGRMVQLSGAFKPNSDIAGSADQVTMSSRLPLWARPKEEITVVQQGSGMSRYRLVVTADGYITMSRYGTSSYATAVKDAYLNISVAYAGADVF